MRNDPICVASPKVVKTRTYAVADVYPKIITNANVNDPNKHDFVFLIN
jgi:hypothetical protein